MSEGFFDELARKLASPMPRRRAVRVLGAAVVVAALPGLRPRSALARSSIKCDPKTEELCSKNAGTQVCMPLGGTCCVFGPESGYDGGLLVGCAKNTRCGSGKPGDRCVCDQHWDAEGNCVDCDEADKCGKNCCQKGQYCASPKKSLCCKDGATYCTVLAGSGSGSSGGKATCCPEGTKCCANDKRSDCCRPGQQCRAGRCTCPDGAQVCGGKCCKTGEHCSNDKCCPKGRVNCGDDYCCGSKGSSCSNGKCCPKGMVNCGGGGKCCAKVDCCGKTCCKGDNVCANGTCCPRARSFGSGKGARCCPPGTVPIANGPTGRTECCPPNDPGCCQLEGGNGGDPTSVLCHKGQTCVAGACAKL